MADLEKLTPGVYQTDEGVFIVKPTKDRQRVYAKRLVEITGDRLTASGERKRIEFEYAPGAVYRIRPEDRMPAEEAKRLTILYGHCIVCGAFLKAGKSVERGIGPVCFKYLSD